MLDGVTSSKSNFYCLVFASGDFLDLFLRLSVLAGTCPVFCHWLALLLISYPSCPRIVVVLLYFPFLSGAWTRTWANRAIFKLRVCTRLVSASWIWLVKTIDGFLVGFSFMGRRDGIMYSTWIGRVVKTVPVRLAAVEEVEASRWLEVEDESESALQRYLGFLQERWKKVYKTYIHSSIHFTHPEPPVMVSYRLQTLHSKDFS